MTRSLRIVVTDDEAAQREILTDILGDEGHEVRAFASAKEALNGLAAAPGDLLLTDLRMPAPDGLVAQIQCHRSLSVTCTPSLLTDLATIIGRDSITLLGPKKREIPFSLEKAGIPSHSAAT